jgi:ADP-ribose pyrophosphatase YjhB (NUDIX family)
MVVATVFVAYEKSLLWVRRAIEPKQGAWAIPGGYVEQGETLQEGAARELREEAGVVIPPDDLVLYMLGSLTFINQVYVGFRARVDYPDCDPGRESLECAFFSRRDCPWQDVAYPEVNEAIVQAYDDLDSGDFHQWQVEMTAESYHRQLINTGPLGP